MDDEPEDWCFEFDVVGSEPIAYSVMESLHLHVVVAWAEARDQGIGGGFRPTPPGGRRDAWAQSWRFRFGLCTNTEAPPFTVPRS